MRLTVLGSGSRGNALLVESESGALLVDAGFPFRELCARCTAAGIDVSRITGITLTHEHGDHSAGAARAASTWSVPVAASAGTLSRLRLGNGTRTVTLASSRPVTVGGFAVTAYPTAHDAADPVMLVVEDGEGRRVGVAYDVGCPTAALQHACRGLDALVIESNHDEHLLRASSYPPSVRLRIAGRGGHLSNSQAAGLVAQSAHASLALVVLAHLSELCNTPELALEAMRKSLKGTAFGGRIVVAPQDRPTPTLDVVPIGQLALPL
jgi:phosphoribosyl 1,2-cyclic phosphodiesterase